MVTIRQTLIKPYKEAKTEEEKEKVLERSGLTKEQFEEIVGIVKKIDIDNIPALLQNARDIQKWIEEQGTTTPPNMQSEDEEEKRLGRALAEIRRSLIKPCKEAETEEEKEKVLERSGLTKEQFEEIVGIVKKIDINNIPALLQNARNIRSWMEEQGRTIPPRIRSEDEEEKRLGTALKTIRRSLKAYKEAKTEEEKEKILERSRLTKKQFEEIVSIVDGIDRNNPKGKKLQEAKDTRDEAKRVRSKAKELEVQVKEALDKKRGKTNDK